MTTLTTWPEERAHVGVAGFGLRELGGLERGNERVERVLLGPRDRCRRRRRCRARVDGMAYAVFRRLLLSVVKVVAGFGEEATAGYVVEVQSPVL